MSDDLEGSVVLMADDQPENLDVLSGALANKGFEILAAMNGKEVFERIEKIIPDIILLDVMMPDISGFDVCARLKQDKRTAGIPVIFISALTQSIDKVEGFKAGGVDFISKPFHVDEVFSRVKTHLSIRRLRTQLENLNKNLEKKVFERTEALEEINQTLLDEISERKEAEKKLSQLSTAIEYAAEDILLTDKDGFITYANPAFEQITGYSVNEVIGKKPQFLKSGEHNASFFQSMWEKLQSGSVWSGRLVNRKKNGELILQEASIAPISDASGEISGFVSVRRDVTERERLKEKLIHARKMEAIGTLAGGIAHDFNNILAGIIGFTELAIEKLPGTKAPHAKIDLYLSRILDSGIRAKHLVKQILQFSRKDAPALSALSVTPLVKEVIKILKSSVSTAIKIQQHLTAEEDTITGDPTQIHRIVMNLCTNACQAMAEKGGQLTIGLETAVLNTVRRFQNFEISPGKYLMITVADTGCGIPPEILQHIFEPYFSTKQSNEGTGLGLSVVMGIVQSCQGLVDVESTPGKGSVFTVFLPLAASAEQTLPAVSRPLPTGKGEQVLIVDDEHFFIEAFHAHLESLGYQVVQKRRGPDALQLFQSDPERFDLVITDQTMPGMTGIQLSREIRKISPATPIILCTGFSETITEKTAEEAGINDILMKPVLRDELSKIVYKVLNRVKRG